MDANLEADDSDCGLYNSDLAAEARNMVRTNMLFSRTAGIAKSV
jgi:hypothetical protein